MQKEAPIVTPNQRIALSENFVLEDHISENGFSPAAIGSAYEIMNDNCWFRDLARIYEAVGKEHKQKIESFVRGFVKDSVDKNRDFLSPLCDINFNLPKEWTFYQNDSSGDMLYMVSESKDADTANIILDFLYNGKVWENPDFGIYEGDGPQDHKDQKLEKRLRASSLCGCGRGLESYQKNIADTHKVRGMLELIYDAVLDILPYECLENQTENEQIANLGLMFCLYPNPILPVRENPKLKQTILKNLSVLEGKQGYRRFRNDRWDGKTHHSLEEIKSGEFKPVYWVYGKLLKSLIINEPEAYNVVKKIKQDFGTIPESMDINGNPNCTPCLIQNEAFFKLASQKYDKK